MSELTHSDSEGKIRMVDVGDKAATRRIAVASARVFLNEETISLIKDGGTPKGNPLEIARIAGIMGAKKTSELIPLCHQIALNKVEIEVELTGYGLRIEATAMTDSKTGVEMEALTAAGIAALTVYDMCKAAQRDIVISDLRLESKLGGKSDYNRNDKK